MDIVKSEINMANEVELCVEVGSNIGDTLLENSDINQLCRTCANTHDNMIPIFEGDGLEHDLQNKIDKHFPVNITKDDGLPNKMCFQCASTLVAWHDMFTGCIEAEKKLKHLLDKLKDDGQVGESVFGSSVVSEDSASDNLKAQQKTGSEMEIDNDDGNDDDYAPEHGGDDDDEDDDDDEEEEEDEEDDDLETEVVLHKLDAKEKEKTVEVSEKGTTIRDQCLRTSSASVSETKPGRKGYSDDCVQKCMMKTLKINLACDECGKKSISDVCVLFHMKQTHERFNVYKCIKCNAAFNCYLKYKIHIEQEHMDCAVGDDDDNSFIQTRRKSRTKQSEGSSNPSVCREEDQSMISDDDSNHVVGDTSSNDDSDNSEEENTNNKKKTSRSSKVKVMKHYTTCSICTIKCRTTLSLLRHWKDMHTTEEAKLDPKYADIINKRTCNICDEFFTDPRLLKIHKKDDHGFENGISFSKEEEEQLKQCEVILDNSGLKTYKCTFCDMRIESARRFLNHVAKHTGQLPFSCELCDKTFSHGYKLRTHVKVVHEGVKDHKCKFCGKAFGERSNMVQHERSVHTAEPCYSCNICGLTFVSSNRLYFHRRTHTNYKPHQCEECKKNFSRKKHLEAHINVSHRTEKSFVCEICGKLFAVRDSLRSHILTHSDARPHKCSICERAFKTRKNLTRHMESQHSLKNELFTAINSLNEQSQ